MIRFNRKMFLSYLIIASMYFSSCSNHEIKDFFNSRENKAIIDAQEYLSSSSSSTIMPQPQNDDLTESYLSYFQGLKFKYNHEELYPNQETLNNIITINEQLNSCTYKFDGNVESLVTTIKENTEKIIKSHPEYTNPFSNDYTYPSVLNDVITNIIEYCKNNTNEDFHQISNMAIVIGETDKFIDQNANKPYLAYYEEDFNVIIVNQRFIESLVEMYDYSYSKYLYYIISHEMNHTRSNVCPCNQNHEFTNINYSDEGYSFLLEASAESDLYNTRNFSKILDSFSYSEERKAEGELLLLGILNDSLDDYYNSIFDINYNLLFEFFDLKNEEEQLDFLRMLYSIDGKFYRNELSYNLINEDTTWVTSNDINRTIGLTYKENIFKHCMINLIEYTSKYNDFSLQENLTLFNIVKSYIIDETYTYDDLSEDNRIYDEMVLMNIEAMERSYIEYLSQKYQVSIDEIRQYENTEIAYIIEAAKYILEDDDIDYGSYSRYAEDIMQKFPVVRGILMSDLDIPYNVYESRISQIILK